ncbi:putative bifunctional diguanylate cyclase/phosphodiesterase [Euzebya tangerina]|uniref:putative bifunctional diguanylate cyclase/phosphodiesterase n=1 Tax=Euzebya tangerina TaxID=591198 RepID=UPI000E321196|nr:EAL domain-containing protein [Euzebya tangerina]
MSTLIEFASPLRLKLVLRVLAVAALLGVSLAGVLAAHTAAVDARLAQTTVVRAQAAFERDLAVDQLSSAEEAASARLRGLGEVRDLLTDMMAIGVSDEKLRPVEAALTAASAGDVSPGEAAGAFAALSASLFELQQAMGEAAEENNTSVKLLISGILIATAVVLGLAGVSAARRSKRLAAAAAEREATQAQELRNRMLAQHASDLVAVIDADTTLQYASPSMTRLLGYDPLEREGLPLLGLVVEQDRENLLVAVTDAIERTSSSGQRTALTMRRADGIELACEMVIVNLLHEPTIGGLAVTIYDVSERKAFEERLTTAAFYDTLTELPNRELLLDRTKLALQATARDEGPTTVALFDLDQFSAIDSSSGREVGDAVLQEVARRLVATVGDHGTVARIGGDEFAVLTSRGAKGGLRLVDLLLDVLRTPVQIAGQEYPCRASAGLATVGDADQVSEIDSPDVMLSWAGTATREAKTTGGDRAVAYHDGMAAEIEERLRLTADLRRALDRNDQLFLEFQPSYDLRTGELKTAEALIRWNHPTEGRLAPYRFIPIAERTGLIVPLGSWVLRESCMQAAQWPMPMGHPPAAVSVNVAAAQLTGAEIVDEVAACLEESGLPPERLILEITETALLDDPDQLTKRLTQIRALGVRIAIDDFGTGYSSLAYLQKLPIDILKVDKSFVDAVATAETDRELATTILNMARNLSLATVAEGIEDADQANVLRALGYDTGQGYLWARPQDPDHLRPYLESGVWNQAAVDPADLPPLHPRQSPRPDGSPATPTEGISTS